MQGVKTAYNIIDQLHLSDADKKRLAALLTGSAKTVAFKGRRKGLSAAKADFINRLNNKHGKS